MKNLKILLISISSIILVLFLALSFALYDVSSEVKIIADSGSYAESYAKENNLPFEAVPDSDKIYSVNIAYLELDYTSESHDEVVKSARESALKVDTAADLKALIPALEKDYISEQVKDQYYTNSEECIKAIENNCEMSLKSGDERFGKTANEWLFADETQVGDANHYDDTENSKVYIILKTGEKELVNNADETPASDFSYNISGDTVTINGYKGSAAEIIIPETIDGKTVSSVNLDAVSAKITSIQIPESVTSVDGTFSTSRYDAYIFVAAAIIIIGYIFSIAATIIGFKKENDIKAVFFGIPAGKSGITLFAIFTVWAALGMILKLNTVVSIVVAVIILAISVIKLIKICFTVDTIQNTDKKVKAQTFFIKSLTVDTQTLMSKAQSDEAKQAAKKVYEAVRYSDPMSNEALATAESAITIKFKEFQDAVINNDSELAKVSADELIVLINDRNQKCKLLK